MFNLIEERRGWDICMDRATRREQGFYPYNWDRFEKGAGTIDDDRFTPPPPNEKVARVQDCNKCGVDGAQQSKMKNGFWACHGCLGLQELVRDTLRELAAGHRIWGTFLCEMRDRKKLSC